ncbi:MAG: enoyl-CoA hydratase/isomerase family protein [Pseudomonadota bacterium]
MEHTLLIDAQLDRLVITLNRPDKANALTATMLRDMAQAVADHHHCQALVLTGVGRVFSAGADLADVAHGGLATDPAWETLSAAVSDFPGLTIAALNGTVAGGAMGMVLACDIRVAVPSAKFFYPVIAKGVDPQPSDTPRLARLIGPARTAEVMILGRKVDCATAHDWGLVNTIADPDALMAAADDMINAVSSAKPGAVARIKAQIAGR